MIIMTKIEEDFILKRINDAFEKDVWHTVTPEYMKKLKKKREEKQKMKMVVIQ